jgi:Protein of unknown function (DUF2652)
MAEQAIILIPDISGFTGFTGATEIDHAAHIITELLELIVASNETDFTLAEIEGDAVLFYRKGGPLRREQLIDQCLRMFSNFHRQLMVIERDTVCQCGACAIGTDRPCGNVRLSARHYAALQSAQLLDLDIG